MPSGEAAAQRDQHVLHGRDAVVLRGELQRVVDVEHERLPVLLLVPEAVERLDVGLAVGAVDRRHRRPPLELGDLGGVGEGIASAELGPRR